jgi:PLP dependent protein
MAINKIRYEELKQELEAKSVELVAVSKIQSVQDINKLYELGQKDFGENYVQEVVDKSTKLPADIRWHFIGHLQTNKVKYIVPFVHLIHGVDSLKLLKEISKQAAKENRVIKCLLQIHIAQEETKFGLNAEELQGLFDELKQKPKGFENVFIAGLMGMASFSNNDEQVRNEFKSLKALFNQYKSIDTSNCKFSILSIGMSGDYKWAIEEGSTMVRIGSLLFGARA